MTTTIRAYLNDYYQAFKDVRKSARVRPLRTKLYGLSTAFVLYLFKSNEGIQQYQAEVISASTRISDMPDHSRNPKSYDFVGRIAELNTRKQLRQANLGFATLIYAADENSELALYRHNCPYLRPSIREFITNRVLDLGVLGRWPVIEYKMHDYDINETQYENLSESSEKLESTRQLN